MASFRTVLVVALGLASWSGSMRVHAADELTIETKAAAKILDSDGQVGSGDAVRHDNSGAKEPIVIFSYKFAPWKDVIGRFAKEAGLELDMDEPPTGTFNYTDPKPYSVTQALDVINGYLLKRGYILVRRDNFLVVANLAAGPIQPNLIPQVSLSELPKRGRNELMCVIMPLGNISAKEAAEEIKDLLGPYPQGKAVPMVAANKLFVTDIGANLRQIQEVLSGMGAVPGKGSVFKSFKLEHISATEADRTLRELFGLPARGALSRPVPEQAVNRSSGRQNGGPAFGGFGGGMPPWGGGGGRGRGRGRDGGDGGDAGEGGERQPQPVAPPGAVAAQRLMLSVDAKNNTLLVTCSVEDIRLVEEAIKTVDVPDSKEGQNSLARGANVPQLEVYPLKSADPLIAVEMLRDMVPGLVIYPDLKAHCINVFAPPADHEQVRNIVKELDSGPGDNTIVIKLRLMEASAAAISLRSLFSSTKQDPPSIEADAAGRRLLVRGSPDQIAQIKQLLTDLGEDGNVAGVSEAARSGPIRSYQPRGRSPAEILGLVQRLLPELDGDFIQIVPPSAIAVPVFHRRDVDQADDESRLNRRRAGGKVRGALRDELNSAGSESGSVRSGNGSSSRTNGAPRPMVRRSPFGVPSDEAVRVPRTSSAEIKDGDSPSQPEKPVRGGLPGGDAGEEIEDLGRRLDDALRDPQESQDEAEPDVDETPGEKSVSTDSRERRESSEVRMTAFGNKILYASNNPAALDRMDRLIQALSVAAPPKAKWTVCHLQMADAVETATMLGYLFPEGTVTKASQSTGTSGFFGGFAALRASQTDDGLGSLSKGGTLRIIPEPRKNALFISGPEDVVEQVMEAVVVLDGVDQPESKKDRTPRMIPIEYADVADVAEIVRDVYKEQLDVGPAGQRDQQQNRGGQGGFNPMAMFMGGGQPQQPAARPRTVQLSIGIDARTNTLVVSASEPLFRQVEALVQSLDDSAAQAKRTVRVVSLHNANATVVQQTLASLMSKVRTSAPRGGRATGPANSQTPAAATADKDKANDKTEDASAPEVDPAAMFLQQRMMMQGMGRGRGGFRQGN